MALWRMPQGQFCPIVHNCPFDERCVLGLRCINHQGHPANTHKAWWDEELGKYVAKGAYFVLVVEEELLKWKEMKAYEPVTQPKPPQLPAEPCYLCGDREPNAVQPVALQEQRS